MMPLIKLQNISKVYGKNDYKTEALKNISLNIDKGEYLAIMGPSGSGKSTYSNNVLAKEFNLA